jgi:hypothetical protein
LRPAHETRSSHMLTEWDPRTESDLIAPLLLASGSWLIWCALSLILGPLWLAFQKPERGILDDLQSPGDDQ